MHTKIACELKGGCLVTYHKNMTTHLTTTSLSLNSHYVIAIIVKNIYNPLIGILLI